MFRLMHPLVLHWFERFLEMSDDKLANYLHEYMSLTLAQREALVAIEALADD